MSLAAHPATSLFPLMSETELRKLADDIAAHGLQHPVVLHEGMVLDGRNRLAACDLIGVPAVTTQWEQDGITPTEWVISTNLHRRHLTVGQRAAIAVEALPLLEAEAKGRQRRAGIANLPGRRESGSLDPDSSHHGRSNEQAAASVGISAPTVKRMKRLKEQAPEMYEAVKAGSKTVSTAHKEAFADGRPSPNGHHRPAPRRTGPPWQRHFTRWCRRVLPEDRTFLRQMSDEVHAALSLLDMTCEEETH